MAATGRPRCHKSNDRFNSELWELCDYKLCFISHFPFFRPSTFQTDATFRTNAAANPATRQHHQHAPHAEPASGGQFERVTDPTGVESGQRPPEPVAPVASVHHAELGGGSGRSGDNGTGRPTDGCPKYDGRTNWQHGKRLGIVGLDDMRDVLNYYFTV